MQCIDSGWRIDPKRYERAIRDAVNKEAKSTVLKMFKEVIEGKRYSTKGEAWKHKVAFRARLQMRGNDAVLYVYPAGKNKDIWNYVSRGTRPHKIRAKNAPYLHFPWGGPGQQPKTHRGVYEMGGPGVTQWARVKEVDHPGSKPRLFEERIVYDYSTKFQMVVRRALANAKVRAQLGKLK